VTAATGRERLEAVFARARNAQRGVLIPYLCAGDPDIETTDALLDVLTRCGVDIVELGIPYGDPLADGPTIAAAAQRALAGGTTLESALDAVRRANGRNVPPILLFTYFNPVLQFGLERFAGALQAAGGAGAIVPDLPPEEAEPLRAALHERGLALPLLVAPTTPLERAVDIAEQSDAFVYLVSRLGVTSAAREPDLSWIAERVEQLRRRTRRPIAVGFGISTPQHVREVCARADGAIVGSALIDAYAGFAGREAARRVEAFVQALAAGRSTRPS